MSVIHAAIAAQVASGRVRPDDDSDDGPPLHGYTVQDVLLVGADYACVVRDLTGALQCSCGAVFGGDSYPAAAVHMYRSHKGLSRAAHP